MACGSRYATISAVTAHSRILAGGSSYLRLWRYNDPGACGASLITMTRSELLDSLSEHQVELAQLGVRSLALFGSVARDEARPDSDVDFVVDFDGGATFDRYVELLFLLERLLDCRVDLVTRRSLHPAVRASAERDLIYVPGLSPVPA